MNKNIIWLILLLVLSACNKGKKSYERISEIDKTFSIEDQGKYNLSDLFMDYSVTLLKGDLIGNIRKIIPYKDKIYFLTGSGHYRFYYYDTTTQKASPIMGKGKGANEMMAISTIKLFQDTLYAFDEIRRDMRRFHLDGSFIDKIDPGDIYEDFEFIDENTLVGYKDVKHAAQRSDEYKISVIKNYKEKNKREVINSYFPLTMLADERSVLAFNLYKTSDSDSSVSFSHPFTDTVYRISKTSISAKYRFDFKGNGIPYKKYQDTKMMFNSFFNYIKKSDKIWNLKNLYENSRFIFFNYNIGSKTHSCFIDKKSGNVVSGFQFVDDIISKSVTHHFSYDFLPLYMDEKSLYVVAQPYYFIDEIQIENLIKPTPLTELSIESNPIILKLNFK